MEEKSTSEFELRLGKAYRRFAPLARRYCFTFARPAVTVGGVPCVLFLGNHSSGKSSLVNWILGGTPVQDTGVAPTDDGFTVLMYGEEEKDVFGPAALSELPDEFRVFEAFGPSFLRHLRVKRRRRDILKTVCLVDSPGMIDSAEGTVTRDYDFEGAVRRFAELCDMVFFLFDPEKPGTTGETVNVFAKCLQGVEFKLRVLLNKCDTLTGIYDFARAYGTLCWNLARVLRTKDLPKIYTTYSGETAQGRGGIDLADFDRHRAEFLAVFSDTAARRADSVFAAAHADFSKLSIRMRLVNRAARELCAARLRAAGLGAALAAVLGAAALFGMCAGLHAEATAFTAKSVLAWAVGGFAAAGALFLTAAWWRFAGPRLRRRAGADADAAFEEEYRRELSEGRCDDLRQNWNDIRAETAETIASAPLDLPLFGERQRARVDAAAAALRVP